MRTLLSLQQQISRIVWIRKSSLRCNMCMEAHSVFPAPSSVLDGLIGTSQCLSPMSGVVLKS